MLKYQKIENILKKRIQDGIYPAGSLFPKQNDLAEEFSTSRVTIRKALDHLIQLGLIYPQRGIGTFVSSASKALSNFETDVDQYVGITKLLGDKHLVESKVINFEIRYPNKKEITGLTIESKDLVYDIERLRIVDNEPYAFEYTVMPVKVIPKLDKKILKGSVYTYIEKYLQQKIGPAYRKISAAKPNDDDQKYLACKMDDPVLKVNQIVSLQNNIPFEFSETHHRFDKESIFVYLPGNRR